MNARRFCRQVWTCIGLVAGYGAIYAVLKCIDAPYAEILTDIIP